MCVSQMQITKDNHNIRSYNDETDNHENVSYSLVVFHSLNERTLVNALSRRSPMQDCIVTAVRVRRGRTLLYVYIDNSDDSVKNELRRSPSELAKANA